MLVGGVNCAVMTRVGIVRWFTYRENSAHRSVLELCAWLINVHGKQFYVPVKEICGGQQLHVSRWQHAQIENR